MTAYDAAGGLPAMILALTQGEKDLVANLSNISALLYAQLGRVNWAGFYRVCGDELVLAPFQGRPACLRIGYGRGVCGTAWARESTQLVPDVHEFPGHIACDADSRSEIVVPLRAGGSFWGVLDIDSPYPGRFTEDDRAVLEACASAIEKVLEASEW